MNPGFLRFACSVVAFSLAGLPACIGRLPPPEATPARTNASSGSPAVVAHGPGQVSPVSGLPVPPTPAEVPRPSGKPGNLQILPWAGYRAAVTYTFDDANSSQIDHYAELQSLGVPMTFYLTTEKPEASSPIWARAVADGHELGNHTRNHAQVARPASIDGASAFIKQTFHVEAYTMASPFGDPSYPPLAATRFLVNRGVVNGLVGANDNIDPFDLPCYVPPQGARAAAFNAEVNSARRAGKWRIMLVHGFFGGGDGAYQPVAIREFVSSVEYAKSLGEVWIDSMVHVAAYWRGQRAFAAASPRPSGQGTVWAWTLPPHFPPGKYLRVKVDGGSLWQGGKTIAWDPHGYYEVALDAGSLQLTE